MAVGHFGALIALMAYKLPGVDAALGDIACLKLPRVGAGSKVLPNAAGEVVAVEGGEDDVRILGTSSLSPEALTDAIAGRSSISVSRAKSGGKKGKCLRRFWVQSEDLSMD